MLSLIKIGDFNYVTTINFGELSILKKSRMYCKKSNY